MSEYDVSAEDVTEAANFLRAYLQAKLPDSDFAVGGVADAVLVSGNAYVYALLKKLARVIRQRQSLNTLAALPEEESVADAADALLSNFFQSRTAGQPARGSILLHFTARETVVIPRGTRFFRSRSHVFYLDSSEDLVLTPTELRPRITAARTQEWTALIPVVAARSGADYNFDAGRFIAVDAFSAYFSYADHSDPLRDGSEAQSTTDFIAAGEDALSLRAPLSARSNRAALRRQFGTVQSVLTIGMGEPEMCRDKVTLGPAYSINVGGHSDVYVKLPVRTVTERLFVGVPAPRADGKIYHFDDSAQDFIAAGVVPGDVLYVTSGLPEAPAMFRVASVSVTRLSLSGRVSFGTATDEISSPPTMVYSVGAVYPDFNDKLSVSSVLARTSRQERRDNAASLAGRVVYRVNRVEIFTADAALDPYRDPLTGTLVCSVQVNTPVLTPPTSTSTLPFQLVVDNPSEGNTALSQTYLEVTWPGLSLLGAIMEVTYDTLADFGTIADYLRSPDNRTPGANVLARGFHPVYLRILIPYRLRRGYVSFDTTVAARDIAARVNAYAESLSLDVGAILNMVREVALAITPGLDWEVTYDLQAPDGRLYKYRTTDRIECVETASNGVTLENYADVGLPASPGATLTAQLLAIGVSDRTVRYIVRDDMITFEERV